MCHFAPEVLILFPVGFNTGGVADDAETQEGDVVQVAGVGDGGTFHVDRQAFGKLAFDVIELGAVGDELIARADEAAMNGSAHFGIGREGAGSGQQSSVCGKLLRLSLHLSVGITFAAPHVVVDQGAARHNVHHAEARVDASRTTGADDGIGLRVSDEVGGADSGIDLADAALHEGDFVGADAPLGEGVVGSGESGGMGEQTTHLLVFYRHGRDNSKFHKVGDDIFRQIYVFFAEVDVSLHVKPLPNFQNHERTPQTLMAGCAGRAVFSSAEFPLFCHAHSGRACARWSRYGGRYGARAGTSGLL